MASFSGGKMLSSLRQVVCEVHGKVKKTDISIPSSDIKEGKMLLYRLGKSSSFSIGIQTASTKLVSTINLKSHQFELHTRPKRLTISFKNDTSRLLIADANEDELNVLVELLNNINSCNTERKIPQQQRVRSSLFHEDFSGNDENQPLNFSNSIHSQGSSETNQFLSSGRMNTPNQFNTKRKSIPFSSHGSSSFYGSGNSNSTDTPRSVLSPKKDCPSNSTYRLNKLNTSSSTSFYGTNSSPIQRQRIVGLSKDFKRKSGLSSFSFKSSSKPSFTDDIQLTGFSNLGNTCYMNAILQSLLGMKPFVQDLCNKNLLIGNPPQSLYKCTYGLLVCKLKNCTRELQNLHLRKFKRAISQAATRFSGYLQHDAHEFLCQVLDQLKDEVLALNKKTSEVDSDSSAELDLTLSCPVTRTFECAVLHTINCKGCGESLTKEEILHDLSLDLPEISNDAVNHAMKGVAIDKLIEDYFKDEELEYCCEECGCKEASISHKFSKLPRVLILHVKRYGFNKDTDRNAKKHHNIAIKKFIDIGRLCTNKALSPIPFQVRNMKVMDVKTPSPGTAVMKSGDNSLSRTSPNVRRQLQQEFDCTPEKRKRVYTIDSDNEDSSSSPGHQKLKKQVQGTPKNTPKRTNDRKVQDISASNEILAQDFKEIASTPLVIETSSGDDHMKDLMSLPEDEQLEWALKESMKTSNGNATTAEEHTADMEIEYDMDCTDDDLLTALDHGNHQTIGLKGGTHSDIEHTSQCDCRYQTIGLKGGAHSDGEQTTHKNNSDKNYQQRNALLKGNISSDSDQAIESDESGLITSSKRKRFPLTCIDSTDTSVDEDGVPKPKKDNSLCAIIDQQPVLNEFDEILIEVDNETGAAKMSSTTPKKDEFVKSSASVFNAKYQPAISKSQSAKKPVRTPSPIAKYNVDRQRLYKSAQTSKARKSLYVKETVQSDYDDDLSIAIQKSLEDQKTCNDDDDDEQMRKAIELSMQESRHEENMDITMKNYLISDDTSSPQKKVQNDSVDSGFQGDDTVSYPYRLVSVVSHLGSKSSSGHYISDVYDCATNEWTSYDDLSAIKVDEHNVRYGHSRDGYIFFYMYKPCVDMVQQSSPSTK